jgi:hypothetical protein
MSKTKENTNENVTRALALLPTTIKTTTEAMISNDSVM